MHFNKYGNDEIACVILQCIGSFILALCINPSFEIMLPIRVIGLIACPILIIELTILLFECS